MQAIRFHGKGDLRLEQIPAPAAPEPGWVTLRVCAAGICGSDLHNFRTGQWVSRLPVTPGHEFCGEITALGAGVSGFAVGERVVIDSRANCGECDYCQRGHGNLCRHMGFVGEVYDGGFAEQSNQPAHRLLKIPDGISDAVAALSEPLGVAMRVIARLQAEPGAPVLIAGGGPIGGLAALLLRELDHRPVLLVERNAQRAALLKEVAGIIPVPLDASQIRHVCGGHEPYYCIEATGSGSVLNQLVHSVASGGRIAMVGLFHGDTVVNTNALVEREIDLVGCSVFRDEQRQAIALLPQLAPKLERLVTAPIKLTQVLAAYQHLQAGESDKLKTIIIP